MYKMFELDGKVDENTLKIVSDALVRFRIKCVLE